MNYEKLDHLDSAVTDARHGVLIPGNPYIGKEEKQGYIGNLHQKKKPELLDLLERQNKLLANEKFISKLPDKGKRISDLKVKIEAALDDVGKEISAELSDEISKLSLGFPNKQEMERFEWKVGNINTSEMQLDSDDDDDDTETNSLKPSKSITPVSESAEMMASSTDAKFKDQHTEDFIRKYDAINIEEEKFKTNKPLHASQYHHTKPVSNLRYDKREGEDTAVTVHYYKFDQVKPISLEESLQLEQKQREELKVLELKQATEKLLIEPSVLAIDYQESKDEASSSEEEDEELKEHDEDRETGVVSFTVSE